MIGIAEFGFLLVSLILPILVVLGLSVFLIRFHRRLGQLEARIQQLESNSDAVSAIDREAAYMK